ACARAPKRSTWRSARKSSARSSQKSGLDLTGLRSVIPCPWTDRNRSRPFRTDSRPSLASRVVDLQSGFCMYAVKVLDFGLAKLAASESSGVGAAALSQSPTLTTPAATIAGVILGTAAYMSPEQARGKVVDRRAD